MGPEFGCEMSGTVCTERVWMYDHWECRNYETRTEICLIWYGGHCTLAESTVTEAIRCPGCFGRLEN